MGYWQYLPIYCLTRGLRLLHSSNAPIASGPILPALLTVDARPHEHFEHFLLHALALIVKRAPGEAEEALRRRRRGRHAEVLARHDAQRGSEALIRFTTFRTFRKPKKTPFVPKGEGYG